tara:strand:- start:340 stop:612 length:273 start_codon:yes stop_codon:yes gene_type:complete
MPTPRSYKNLFGRGRIGPAILAEIFEYAGFFDHCLYKDEMAMARHEGQRDVILFILDKMGISGNSEGMIRNILRTHVKRAPIEERQQYSE